MLSYPAVPGAPLDAAAIAGECGKLVVLDRLLVKLRAAGHRVLLFSTMTRLLDLLQVQLSEPKPVFVATHAASLHQDPLQVLCESESFTSVSMSTRVHGEMRAAGLCVPLMSTSTRLCALFFMCSRCAFRDARVSRSYSKVLRIMTSCVQAYLAARVLPNGDTMRALRIDGSTSLEDRCGPKALPLIYSMSSCRRRASCFVDVLGQDMQLPVVPAGCLWPRLCCASALFGLPLAESLRGRPEGAAA